MRTRKLIPFVALFSTLSCDAPAPPGLPAPSTALVVAGPGSPCRDELTLVAEPPRPGRTGVVCGHPRHRLEVSSSDSRVIAVCVCTEEPPKHECPDPTLHEIPPEPPLPPPAPAPLVGKRGGGLR